MSTEKGTSARIPALDGLRGIAVLLVLLGHFGSGGGFDYPKLAGRLFFSVVRMGWAGVDLFFVLSGFLITGILYDTKDDPRYFRNFYMRRVLRIFPLYYGTLVAVFLILPLLTGEAVGSPANQKWLWVYCSNFYTALTGGYAGQPNAGGLTFGHFWSLAVEEHFYLIWPLIVYVTGRRSLMFSCLAVVVLAFGLRTYIALAGGGPNFMTPCRMDSIALGAIVAMLARGGNGCGMLLRYGVVALIVSSIGLAALWPATQWNPCTLPMVSIGYTVIGVFFAAVLAISVEGASRQSTLATVLSLPVLRSLGKYSYGIYVFHGLFLGFLGEYILPVAWLHQRTGRYVISVFGHFVCATLASIAIAWVSWHLYEKHFLKLKRLFEPRSARPLAVSSHAGRAVAGDDAAVQTGSV